MKDVQYGVEINNNLTSGSNTEIDARRLLRQLVNCAGGEGPVRKSILQGEIIHEVLIEIHVDGVCYSLTRTPPPKKPTRVQLSSREQEVVRLVAKGFPNKAIAEVLGISPWTVATHLRRIFSKLGVKSRAEMVACTFENGLLRAGSEIRKVTRT